MQNLGQLKLQINIKCGQMDIPYIPMKLTEDFFALVSGNQLACYEFLNTKF